MSTGRTATSLILVGAVLVSAPALAVTVDLSASKDNTLFEEDGKKSNGVGDYFFAGNTDSAETRRGVIAFDLSPIPPGSTINSVTLQLYMSRTQAGNVTVGVHRILSDWGESVCPDCSNAGGQEGGGDGAQNNDATWRYSFYNKDDEPSSIEWTTLGGDFVAGASATTSVGGNGFYTWSGTFMVTDVQNWLDGTQGNYGWLVKGGEAGNKLAKRFNSRHIGNSSQRPKLTVDYTPPAASGACCFLGETCLDLTSADCGNQGGTFQGNGTNCATTTCVDPTGACCATTSPWACTAQKQLACEGGGGTYFGDNTLCGTDVIECPVVLSKWVDDLPIPGVATPVSGSAGGTATYHIVMQEFEQQLHSELPNTTVWGYGARPDPFTPGATYATFPGPTIEARADQQVTIRYFNDLREWDSTLNPKPLRASHYLPVDTCAHGANDQSPRSVVHLHGGHVQQDFDGYPESTFIPGKEAKRCVADPLTVCDLDADCPTGLCDGDGASCTSNANCVGHGGTQTCIKCEAGYQYPNRQNASTLWFHDHALGITRLNVYMGMASFYLIRDALEDSLNLPSGSDEIPIVIQDRTFHTDGTWSYPTQWVENFFGDKVLVNGKVWPKLDVKQGKYRFRLLNGSNSRRYTISLDRTDDGTLNDKDLNFNVVGADGGLLPETIVTDTLIMGPAERYDMIVDFETIPAGTEVFLRNDNPIPGAPDITDVLKFVVLNQAGDTTAIPQFPNPGMEVLDPADAVRTREFLLRKASEPCTGQHWVIKSRNESGVDVGELWDDLTEFPQLGTTEIWEFANPTVVPHPMHMHLVFFQILNRQDFELQGDQIVPLGSPIPPAPEEAGWKDTARTEPGQLLRVIARFEDYEGKYAYHCHILEHEDHEMMRQFVTVGGVGLNADASNITWGAVTGATGYDLIRGNLSALVAAGGDYSDVSVGLTCEVNGLLVQSFPHTGVTPAPGEAAFWLSRFRDAVGRGTYDSGASSQVGLRDGEIAASGNDCP